MTLITEGYRALNLELHRTSKGYGAGGGYWADEVLRLVDRSAATSVLDYGCGKGTLGEELRKRRPGLDVRDYDPCVPGRATAPARAHIVACTDVLEHVEPDLIGNVLDHLVDRTERAALLVIACKKGSKRLPDGSRAHKIVESPAWWLDRLKPYGRLEFRPASREKELAVVLYPEEA